MGSVGGWGGGVHVHVAIVAFPGLLIKMLLFVPLTDGEKEVGTVKHLQENKIYSRGNHKDFTAFLQKQTKKDNPKVQYNF